MSMPGPLSYPCVESTLDITRGCRTLRLWIQRGDTAASAANEPYYPPDLYRYLGAIDDPTQLLELVIAKVPLLNAVQLQWWNESQPNIKHGTVIYTVSFDDPHG